MPHSLTYGLLVVLIAGIAIDGSGEMSAGGASPAAASTGTRDSIDLIAPPIDSLGTMDLVNPEEGMEEDSAHFPKKRNWFVLFGAVNVYPKLEREKLIKKILDPVVDALAPGYAGTHTFTDMRDDGLMWPPQLSVGRVLSDYFALSVHGGYTPGTVRTNKSNPSIFSGIPLHTEVKIKRWASFVGVDLDYYPFRMAELKKYANWWERLRAARPTLGARVTYTWAGFDARINFGFGFAEKIMGIRLHEEWELPSLTLVAGVDIPINHRNTFILNGGYTFFKEQRQDFNGPVFTLGWRYMF